MESIMFRIMNLKELHQLEEEIDQMDDAKEKEARSQLIEQIMEKITDYDVHVRGYAYQQTIQSLVNSGITYAPTDRASVVNAWDQLFDSMVSEKSKQSAPHYSDQFRWHLFSFGLLDAIKEDEARAVFDSMPKKELFLFFDYSDQAFLIKNAHMLTAADVEALRENSPLNLSDMYFFDPANRWTYIKPHEEYCGPYFFKID